MKTSAIYRGLLRLYPSAFRQQFSEEMISVFEQRAGEHFAHRQTASFAFLLTEFSGIVRGAYIMWLSNISTLHRRQSESGAAASSILSGEEAAKLRSQVIQQMVAAIADHDFVAARRFSDEEARLKQVIEELENPPASRRKLA
jgi:hypothetical protein